MKREEAAAFARTLSEQLREAAATAENLATALEAEPEQEQEPARAPEQSTRLGRGRPSAEQVSQLHHDARDWIVNTMGKEGRHFTVRATMRALNLGNWQTAKRLLDHFEERGVVQQTGETYRRGALYRYVPPAERPGAEGDAHLRRPTTDAVQGLVRRAAVAGSGRGTRLKPEVQRLVTAAGRYGFTPEVESGHVKLRRGSELVVMPSTPSDHRALKNARAELRRRGVNV